MTTPDFDKMTPAERAAYFGALVERLRLHSKQLYACEDAADAIAWLAPALANAQQALVLDEEERTG